MKNILTYYVVIVFGLLMISILLISCSNPAKAVTVKHNTPAQLDDGIEVGNITTVRLDDSWVNAAKDAIRRGKYGEVHSILVYKEGKLVVEEYFMGHDYDWEKPQFQGDLINWNTVTRHNVHSVGKTLTSACIGIAVEEGFIDSVDDSIFLYLPEYKYLNTGGKDQITIEHLLTMTAGLQWDEWGTSYKNESNDVINLWFGCEDPIACILEKPLVHKPGTQLTYSGGNSVVLGKIIENATGRNIEAFSWEYLFSPLGIESPSWKWIEDTGVIYAAGDQYLSSRDMLKFGVMYLNDGKWDGEQVLPQEWVKSSESPYTEWLNGPLNEIPPGDNSIGKRGYSYAWWTHSFYRGGRTINAYWAFGWGGQKIVVIPEEEMVVVFTGANYSSTDATANILIKYILPAIN